MHNDSSDSVPPGRANRLRARNAPTVLGAQAPAPATRRLRRLFTAAYPQFGPRCHNFGHPGVAVVAICEQTRALAGFACLPAVPRQNGGCVWLAAAWLE